MIEVFDRATRRRMAILENARAISEDLKCNAIGYLSFSLPDSDPKNAYCRPFHYVRPDGGELYRIMPSSHTVEETGEIAYQCEHVLATLIDSILFGHHVVGNLGTYTADVIRYILAHQLERHWVLAECDFRSQYEYGWEQENLLSALFSVAAPLAGPCLWRTDTTVYPWRLSLKRLDIAGPPQLYVRRRHNMTSLLRESDPQQVVTRLYPLGYGEGVNQLGISAVNGGVPYLQSPRAITDRYGIIERVWIDRRYEDPASLKAAAQAVLDALQEPLISYEVGFQELGVERAEIGQRVRVIDPESGEGVDTFITGVSRDAEDVARSTVTIANRETSIASTLADMADRQRIEQAYAQGATQIYSQAIQANCDKASGAVMDFFIPEEMRIINKVLVKIRMGPFRSYSRSTESEKTQVITSTSCDDQTQTSTSSESTTYSSDSGGAYGGTSSDGGEENTTSDAGGGETLTASTGVDVTYETTSTMTSGGWPGAETDHFHNFRAVLGHHHRIQLPDHAHRFRIKAHSHDFDIPDHSHQLRIPGHAHRVTIPGHDHTVTVPAHAHSITPGIFLFGDPKKFSLYVNGTKKADFSGQTAELDVTAFLLGADKRIPRGSWLSLEVRPDDLAYISIDLVI